MQLTGKVKAIIGEVYDLYAQRRFDEAIAKGIAALEKHGEVPDLLLVLGLISVERDDLANARVLLDAAYAGAPDNPDIAYNLGVVLQKTDELPRAVALWEDVVRARPDHVAALKNLSISYLRQERFADVIAQCDLIFAQTPDDHDALNWKAISLYSLERFDEAQALYQHIADRFPKDAEAHYRLGLIARDMGDVTNAVDSQRRAIAVQPTHADAHFELAQALLLQGHYEEGFGEYEWRRKRGAWHIDSVGAPFWNGEDITGKSLLVTAEQGHGDAIQFMRYLPLAAARAGRLSIAAHSGLMALFAKIDGVDAVEEAEHIRGRYDVQVPIMSLAHLFATTLETIPQPGCPAVDAVADLPGQTKVGVVWAGNAAHQNDRRRSCPVEAMAKLFAAAPDTTFFSFQVGERAGELASVSADNVVDLSTQLTDYETTARYLKAMDLVVAVDTSVLHLAATLGVPTWGLVPDVPDWRWLLGRADSPWYPSLRLYRQDTPGDWDGVIARVIADLADL